LNRVFIDTSYLIALLLPDDAHHHAARRLQTEVVAPLVTTEYVLVELGNSVVQRHLRDLTAAAIEAVHGDPSTVVIPASTQLLQDGLNLFARRPDKNWGLTDCISFVVMQREGVTEALTADRQVEQAGFKAPLRGRV
jgi:predicted nucleic acid-binding protein